MFGLNFVQGAFLFAGLTAAIPVIIHLLLKQRARRVDIGSVRFLQKVLKEHNAMRRIREWMLLAARIITALLLAFLFARPFFDRTSLEAGQREVVYLLDRSASMQFEADGTTTLERAYDALRDEIEQIHEETIVRIAAFDSEGVEEIDWQQNYDPPEPSFAATDYGKAIGWARDALQQSTRAEREIILFTDLQESGLGRTPLGEFPRTIKFQMRDFGKSISKNQSIARAEATAVEIRPKLPPKVEVDVLNGSPVPIEAAQVTLQLKPEGDGKPIKQTKELAIAGGEISTVEFEIPDATEGVYVGRVSIAAKDELAFDNTRHVAFEARRPDRILVVDGEEGSNVYGDETYYFLTALQVGETSSDREVPSFEVERIVWDNGKGFPDLAGFRAIVLANVGSFTASDANRLKGYLESGGRVLVCCGDKFTRRAARPLVDVGVLPVEVEGVGSLGPYRMVSWNKDHEVLKPFKDPQYGDLRRLQFQQVALLKPTGEDAETNSEDEIAAASEATTTLASMSRGLPLCVESHVGKGKVIVWASTVDPAWSDWPQGRLFVPLVRQLMAYLTDHHERQHQIEEVVATKKPGVSRVDGRVLVANVDPQESNLTRVSPEKFRETLRLPEKQELGDLSAEELAALAPPPGAERPEEIWRWVAWILLGWLILETFLAGQVHA